MAKSKTLAFQLECPDCKKRNYVTSKNPTENKDKIEISKFCNQCRKHTKHKEVKIAKAKK